MPDRHIDSRTRWWYCHCTCHSQGGTSRARHAAPCCSTCRLCGRGIIGNVEAHHEELHGKPIFETRELAPGVSATFKPGVEPTAEGVKSDLAGLAEAIKKGDYRPFTEDLTRRPCHFVDGDGDSDHHGDLFEHD